MLTGAGGMILRDIVHELRKIGHPNSMAYAAVRKNQKGRLL